MNQEQSVSREIIDMQIALKRAGRRKLVRHGRTLCSKCLDAPPTAYHRCCRPCKNAWERERWRMAQDARKGAQ